MAYRVIFSFISFVSLVHKHHAPSRFSHHHKAAIFCKDSLFFVKDDAFLSVICSDMYLSHLGHDTKSLQSLQPLFEFKQVTGFTL